MEPITRTIKEVDQVATGLKARKARKKAHKSLRQVACNLGFSVSFLSDLERGRRNWTEQLLKRFERAL